MRLRPLLVVVLVVLLISSTVSALADAAAQPSNPAIRFTLIGRYASGLFDEGAAEIAAYDPASQTVFVVNAARAAVDALSIANPRRPVRRFTIDVSQYGAVANSVAVYHGLVAVAVENDDAQAPGRVAFFDNKGAFLSAVTAGALPDMLTFTPDGRRVLVANEGEPNDDYTNDPEGSVSVIDVGDNAARITQANVTTIRFNAFNVGGSRRGEWDSGIRVYGPRASVAQDLEPEYITVSPDSRVAWVTLQENNALAILDLRANAVARLVALGYKDHSAWRNRLDASDKDGGINLRAYPVWGMYQPDAIAAYRAGGRTYLATANEGDGRDYTGYSEETRVADVKLEPGVFPDAARLQTEANLGRLKITNAQGDSNGDGEWARLYAFGARSFSIWTASGQRVYDSGADFERITASVFPTHFNDDGAGPFDSRSDDKGPEPTGVTIGVIKGRTYAFIGLERIGGVMIYDVTQPMAPRFVQYVNNRNFAGDPAAGTAGDLGPEGLVFIPAHQSPSGQPLLVVANQVSGSTTIYEGR